jgi:hypothetical protein
LDLGGGVEALDGDWKFPIRRVRVERLVEVYNCLDWKALRGEREGRLKGDVPRAGNGLDHDVGFSHARGEELRFRAHYEWLNARSVS